MSCPSLVNHPACLCPGSDLVIKHDYILTKLFYAHVLPYIASNSVLQKCWIPENQKPLSEGDFAFRRQFVAELLMSDHGSSLANAELAEAVEDVIYRACTCAATYAADLVQHAGALQDTISSWTVFSLALRAVPAFSVH